jgi:hypothetical protein
MSAPRWNVNEVIKFLELYETSRLHEQKQKRIVVREDGAGTEGTRI